MMSRRKYTAFLVCASAVSCALPAAAAGRYDGRWNMVAETTRGHCGVISVGLGISGRRIFSIGGSFAFNPIRLGGRISSSGHTRLTAVTGPRLARGTGRFTRTLGSGTWSGTGPSGLCSGVWTAQRF